MLVVANQPGLSPSNILVNLYKNTILRDKLTYKSFVVEYKNKKCCYQKIKKIKEKNFWY